MLIGLPVAIRYFLLKNQIIGHETQISGNFEVINIFISTAMKWDYPGIKAAWHCAIHSDRI